VVDGLTEALEALGAATFGAFVAGDDGGTGHRRELADPAGGVPGWLRVSAGVSVAGGPAGGCSTWASGRGGPPVPSCGDSARRSASRSAMSAGADDPALAAGRVAVVSSYGLHRVPGRPTADRLPGRPRTHDPDGLAPRAHRAGGRVRSSLATVASPQRR
jgi:hypothetical protein